jgi:hypothetical protein
MQIPVEIYDGRGLSCLSETCRFRQECAEHASAGDYRSEDGFTPEITVADGEYRCATADRPVYMLDSSYDNPDNVDHLPRGSRPLKYYLRRTDRTLADILRDTGGPKARLKAVLRFVRKKGLTDALRDHLDQQPRKDAADE